MGYDRSMRKHWSLLLIVGCYLLIGGLYAAQVPAWQAPDEPAHYNYVRQLAAGSLPVIAVGDYDQAYLDEIRGAKFAPGYSVADIEYEDWQPPLFYLLLTPAYLAASGDLFALRLVSLLFGAGVIVLAYGCGRLLFPQQGWVAWSTAVFATFLPQQLSIFASVNNDSLALLLIAAILYLLLYWAGDKVEKDSQQETRLLIGLGVLLGLGFLTKGTVYLMTAVIGFTILWQYWREWKQVIRAGLLVFVPAFLLGAIWWVRNMVVYGGLDVLGKAAHDAVVVGQPRTEEWIALYGVGGTITQFVRTTFNSFWGQFGWMAVPMPNWVYLPLLVMVGTAVIGLIIWVILRKKEGYQTNLTKLTLSILLLLTGLTLGLHIGYNLTFVQHQGRYLFPAVIPIGLGLGLGLGAWGLWLERPFNRQQPILPYLVPLALGIILAGLDVFALYRFIIPSLAIG